MFKFYQRLKGFFFITIVFSAGEWSKSTRHLHSLLAWWLVLMLCAGCLVTHHRRSWCPRRARPWHSGSPRPGPWCSACWGPGSAGAAWCCSRGCRAAGWWSAAASCPRWSRSTPGRSPASGTTASTERGCPWSSPLLTPEFLGVWQGGKKGGVGGGGVKGQEGGVGGLRGGWREAEVQGAGGGGGGQAGNQEGRWGMVGWESAATMAVFVGSGVGGGGRVWRGGLSGTLSFSGPWLSLRHIPGGQLRKLTAFCQTKDRR